MPREDLKKRINEIEESYEFFLAYAAQGMPSDQGAKKGGDLRNYLERMEKALTGLTDRFRELTAAESSDPGGELGDYMDVLEGDQNRSLATVRLVRAQPSISSALIDNLNASIHIRALLTDVFLIDEILKVLPAEKSE